MPELLDVTAVLGEIIEPEAPHVPLNEVKLRRLASTMVREIEGQLMARNTICIWYDKEAGAAARFYAEGFPERELWHV